MEMSKIERSVGGFGARPHMDMNTSLTIFFASSDSNFYFVRVQDYSPGSYKFCSFFLYIVGSASTKAIITTKLTVTKRIIFPTATNATNNR